MRHKVPAILEIEDDEVRRALVYGPSARTDVFKDKDHKFTRNDVATAVYHVLEVTQAFTLIDIDEEAIDEEVP